MIIFEFSAAPPIESIENAVQQVNLRPQQQVPARVPLHSVIQRPPTQQVPPLHSVIQVASTRTGFVAAQPVPIPNRAPVQQVSWVKMRGYSIPAGAFVGGRDSGGEFLYVGRAEHQKSLTPGEQKSSTRNCKCSNFCF